MIPTSIPLLTILIGTISSAVADQTYLDRFNPTQTRHTIQSDVRLIPEIDEDKIARDYEYIQCEFDGTYYVYKFSGAWDVGFALSRFPILENENCADGNGALSAKYIGYLDQIRTKLDKSSLGSVRLNYQFYKAGTCPDGRVYFWENLYLYESESSNLETAIYAIYGAC